MGPRAGLTPLLCLQTNPETGTPAAVKKQRNQSHLSHCEKRQTSEARRACLRGCLLSLPPALVEPRMDGLSEAADRHI